MKSQIQHELETEFNNLLKEITIVDGKVKTGELYRRMDEYIARALKDPKISASFTHLSLRDYINFIILKRIVTELDGSTSTCDVDGIRRDFFELLNSLPYSYSIYVPMPTHFPTPKNDIALTKSLSLIAANAEKIDSFAIQKIGKENIAHSPSKQECLYFKIEEKGILSDFSRETMTQERVENILKTLYFIIYWHGGFRHGYHPTEINQEDMILNAFYRRHDSQTVGYLRLPKQLLKTFTSIFPDPSLIRDESNLPMPQEAINEYVISTIKIAAREMEERFDDAQYQRAIVAISYWFDSISDDHLSSSFIKACIGFEALLGTDERSTALTDTLADRYAYLVSSSPGGRKGARDDFLKLYRKRSTFLHQKDISMRFDYGADNEARVMLEIAIARELGLFRFA